MAILIRLRMKLSQRELLPIERVSSKRQHHEWPQNKEDQHDFVPMEKPQKVYLLLKQTTAYMRTIFVD